MIEHRVVSQETGSDSFPGSWYIAGFSPDSRWLAWVAKDRSNPHYYVWNVGRDTDEPPRRVLAVAKPDAVLKDFESLSFDPLSKRTVTTHFHYLELKMDYFMRVWDNDTGELLVEMTEAFLLKSASVGASSGCGDGVDAVTCICSMF